MDSPFDSQAAFKFGSLNLTMSPGVPPQSGLDHTVCVVRLALHRLVCHDGISHCVGEHWATSPFGQVTSDLRGG